MGGAIIVRKFISVLLVLSLVPAILGAYARNAQADQTVFGPAKFLRTTGAFNTVEKTFLAEAGAGKLIIKNGEEDSQFRVTSAQVYLNDVPVFEPDDFKQDIYGLAFPIDLKRANALRIEIGGKPGTFLIIEITQEQTASPPVFEPVAEQTVFEEQELTVTVHAQDPDNDPLIYSAANLPPGAVFDPATQTFPWTPAIGQAGVYSPQFTVSDGDLTDSVSVRITVLANPPAVSLSADPETIAVGEAATLFWTSTYADSASLEPVIGTVDVNGSLVVTPEETTLYTISVSGPGGTATDAAAVNVVHPPTVTFSARPADINGGETATLTWVTTNADSVNIEPDIGVVDPCGTMTVSPLQTTTYTLTASGSGLTKTAAVTITVNNPIAVQITSPLDGVGVNAGSCLVKGIVTNDGNGETGVTVNGVIALMDGDEFTANHVMLMDGENRISATATDVSGNTRTDAITIYADTPGDYIELTADIVSGLAPFETTLRIDASFDFTASDISYTGPGTVTVLVNTPEEYRVLMTMEGLYTFTATVTDELGLTYTNSIVTEAVDAAALDGLLQPKWSGMKAELSSGDIDAALSFIAGGAREMFRYNFELLNQHLPEMSAGLHGITLVNIVDGEAEYEMAGEQDGQLYSFYLLFIKDNDGIWRIRFF